MTKILFEEISRTNWQAALQLAVAPEQQRFVSDHTPIAAIVLAKAYVQSAGLQWVPYAIIADSQMVGMCALAYEPGNATNYWLYHFFIDRNYQGRGYGKAALGAFLRLLQETYPACQHLNLTVHPANIPAQRLYARLGFQPTGAEQHGELVYAWSKDAGSDDATSDD